MKKFYQEPEFIRHAYADICASPISAPEENDGTGTSTGATTGTGTGGEYFPGAW